MTKRACAVGMVCSKAFGGYGVRGLSRRGRLFTGLRVLDRRAHPVRTGDYTRPARWIRGGRGLKTLPSEQW